MSSYPDCEIPKKHRNFQGPAYGLDNIGDIFTPRQLTAMTALSDLIAEARKKIEIDMVSAGHIKDGRGIADDGRGPRAYAECVATYLSFIISKTLDYNCSLVPWYTKEDRPGHLFSKQAIPMVWDFTEMNPLGSVGGTFIAGSEIVAGALAGCAANGTAARVTQDDAIHAQLKVPAVVSTDPPYYDNIAYADLSDFFYVWLRRSMQHIFPDLFATLAVPKAEELVATPTRHGGKENAEKFFLEGMTRAMERLAQHTHPSFPATIYYAFKQSETDASDGTASTGWETFLAAVIRAGFALTGTWPIRTERGSRSVGIGANALASSIILVCRPRIEFAAIATRREFLNALKAELPEALRQLQRGNIAPVDLAQASIGPGMAVFTRYEKVMDAEGRTLSVREALALINAVLDEVLAEQEGDFDADSRFALAWFEQFGFAEGEFGVADVLARAKVTSVAGLAEAGLLASRAGKVRLLTPAELPASWNPANDPRLTVWEMVHHLIRVLEAGGEAAAGALAARLGARAEIARELAYRLYSTAERKKRAAEALQYNGLVQSWPEIMRLAREGDANASTTAQADMFGRA